ncbi:hypothetical protein FXO37_01473 [Capsicum annuum]|nr:hypothetical protein FXO37_01473 [Capsicum annuum]
MNSKEIRSKFRNDPVKMTEILKKKTLKKTSSPKDQKIKKYEKKRKAKEIDADDDVLHDEIFIVRKLSRFAPHMCSYSDNDIDGNIRAILNKEQYKKFCDNIIFGYFMKKKHCVVQAQLCRCVMSLEIKGSSSSAIVIRANDTSLNFTSREFAIITGLNCLSNRYDFVFYRNVPNIIVEKYFNGAEFIQKRQLFLVVFKNIEPTQRELAKFQIPEKDVFEDERSVDSDDDFQNPPPKRTNYMQKKKKKVDSSTPSVKKSLRIKSHNVVDEHTENKTPLPRCCKESPVEEETVSKPESPIEKKSFISKKVFDVFRDEEQFADKEAEQPNVDDVGLDRSGQHFSPNIVQTLNNIFDGTKINPNVEIDSQHLIHDELLRSINLDYIHSEKFVQHDGPISDEKMDETNLFDLQFTIPDEILPSLNVYRRESITTHPSITCEEELTDEYLNDKKSEYFVEDHCQTNKENVGLSSKSELHREVDLGIEEKIMTPPDEQRDEPVCHDSQNTIPDELLPSLNVYSRSSAGHIRIFPQKHSFVYHPIDGIVDTKIVKKFMDWISVDFLKGYAKRKRNVDHYKKGKSTISMMHFGVETVEDKNLFYTMGFPDQSWTNSQIDVCFYYLRKKSKYDPNRSYKYNTVDCNFMDIIRFVHDVYSVDDPNLTAGGQEAHLNEYINGLRMHTLLPWHTIEDIYIPVNIKEKHHWVLTVLSFSERCIFLYDSYESSSHYSAVFAEIRKLAEIIPLCLQDCDFYDRKGIDLQNHSRYKDKDSSNLFDVLFKDNLPQ